MPEKENRPSAATLERSRMETAPGKAAISVFYCTTTAANGQPVRIADFLDERGRGRSRTHEASENCLADGQSDNSIAD